jgi:hypothetical protein
VRRIESSRAAKIIDSDIVTSEGKFVATPDRIRNRCRLPGCRTLVLAGAPGLFCTGMDFQEVATNSDVSATETVGISEYMLLLKRFTLSSKVIVCQLDGKVIAGGVGLVAAAISSSQPNARNSAFRRRSGVCYLVV